MEDHRLDPLGQSVFGIGERRERTAAGSVAGLDRNAAGVSNRVMPERIEIVEGDITTLDVDAIVNAPTKHCLAAAGSMAPSIAPQGQNCARHVLCLTVAPRAKRRSPLASGSQPATSFTRWARSGAEANAARTGCSHRVTQIVRACRRPRLELDRLSLHLDRRLRLPDASRGAHRRHHRSCRPAHRAGAEARRVLLLRQGLSRSPRYGACRSPWPGQMI